MPYAILCSHCGTIVVTATQVGAPEAAELVRHLSDTHPQLVEQSRSFRELLKNFSVRGV
jgi:hypothetical protein